MAPTFFKAEQWARWLDHATTDAMARGMKMVVIEPRLSHTASKSNEWLPIRPGKDVLLLLGMAKQLIDSNTIDIPFLTGYTNATCLVGPDGHFLRNSRSSNLISNQTLLLRGYGGYYNRVLMKN